MLTTRPKKLNQWSEFILIYPSETLNDPIFKVCKNFYETAMKIVITTNLDWFFISHRLPIALAALKEGHKVYLLAKDTGRRNELEELGIKFIDIPINPAGKNPIEELRCMLVLARLYRKIKPDVIHHVTIKASLLGCLAAKLAGVKCVVNAISGFGYAFTDGRKGLLQRAIKLEMDMAFKSKHWHFILQNPDDIASVKATGYVPDDHVHLIKGSGVDLNEFTFSLPTDKEKQILLFPARILGDKGVMELIQAMNSVKAQIGEKAKLVLAGDLYKENPTSVPEDVLNSLVEKDYIEWIGYQKNMVDLYRNCDIVVLPSYREGLPKSLIEACAIGRPIITTDVVGCRECVVEGYNGVLVPAKNVEQLASAIVKMVNDRDGQLTMGKNGRVLAERDFSIESVIEKHFKIYNLTQKEK